MIVLLLTKYHALAQTIPPLNNYLIDKMLRKSGTFYDTSFEAQFYKHLYN